MHSVASVRVTTPVACGCLLSQNADGNSPPGTSGSMQASDLAEGSHSKILRPENNTNQFDKRLKEYVGEINYTPFKSLA